MKWITSLLIVLILIMQYKLWFAPSSVPEVLRLKHELQLQIAKSEELQKRNRALDAEVTNLKAGRTALEERARTDLGMIKDDEVFYQIIETL